MRKATLMMVVASLAAAPAGAQAPPTELETVRGLGAVDRTTQTQDVQFANDPHERMTVPVRLSGQGPYRFLVDTGADRTAVSRQVAQSLNLRGGRSASLHSISGVSTVSTVMLPDLQMTGRTVKVDGAPLLEQAHIGADGILGTDSLRSQRVMFDFEADTMSIVPSATQRMVRDDPDTIVVTGTRRNGRLIMTRANADGQRVDVVLDTGSQVSIGNAALRRALSGRRQLKNLRKVELLSVTGEVISGEYMEIRSLDVGGFELRDMAIVFADAHTFKQLRLDHQPAILLGMNAMRAFKKVSIDFAQRKLRVVLPEDASALQVRLASL